MSKKDHGSGQNDVPLHDSPSFPPAFSSVVFLIAVAYIGTVMASRVRNVAALCRREADRPSAAFEQIVRRQIARHYLDAQATVPASP